MRSEVRRTASALSAFVFFLTLALPAEAQRRGQPAAPAAKGSTLEERLESLFRDPVATQSDASLEIIEVDTGRIVAQHNAGRPVAPASNMKLFTTAAAIELLHPEFRFTTTVKMRGKVDPVGTLHGDVIIVGKGDPTIGSRFHDGNATAVIERWARDLKRNGVKTIDGDLIFEHGYFDDEWVHPTWPEDQLVNWYEAPISALSIQEGCVLVRVSPTRNGETAKVEMIPPNEYMTVQNTCVTSSRGRGVFIARKLGSNEIIVRGNAPPNMGPTEIFVTVKYPVNYFANVVHTTFQREGINVRGQVLMTPKDPRNDWTVISEHSTPLPVVNFVINKKSQNFYAEQLLKTIGAEVKGDGSFSGGSAAISEWLTGKLGVPESQFTMVDGSGMSRFNRASANAFVQLLRHMWSSPRRLEFISSMPYSGEEDSRLRRRMHEEPYARNVYAKTGYISNVIGLSGYVRGQSGKVYAFSLLFNKYRTGVWGVYRLQDEILKEVIRNG